MRHRMNDMLKYISIFAVTVMVTAADVYSSGIVSSDNLSGSLPGISIDGDINPVSGTVEVIFGSILLLFMVIRCMRSDFFWARMLSGVYLQNLQKNTRMNICSGYCTDS